MGKEQNIDWAFVGFEDPLAVGLCDELQKVGIKSVGPMMAAAQLEASKLFTRELMQNMTCPDRCHSNVQRPQVAGAIPPGK